MDRVEGNSVFTLKYITDFINSLNFKEVIVIEPHSDVTPALLNNCRSVFPSFDILNNVMKEVNFNKDKDYLFFPDQGAAKRYGKTKGFKQLVGFKERDFQTGKINKLQVIGDIQEQGFKVIIQDDLCSYGGTFLMSGNKLKELGASEIYLLVTHCENSIYQGELLKENSPIDKIFTTDSILTLGTDKIITYSLN
jgi:ribose-phosphate pyrophosphokinase